MFLGLPRLKSSDKGKIKHPKLNYSRLEGGRKKPKGVNPLTTVVQNQQKTAHTPLVYVGIINQLPD